MKVSAFSTWEKELHKIVFDPRYLLLTSKERKQVFEKYVKERAEEERREKRNKMKERKDQFQKLLEEASLHGKSVLLLYLFSINFKVRYLFNCFYIIISDRHLVTLHKNMDAMSVSKMLKRCVSVRVFSMNISWKCVSEKKMRKQLSENRYD